MGGGNGERRKRQTRPGLIHLAVLVGYALLTLVMTWPLAAHLRSAIPGDGFDGWQNYWNLWWLKTALVERLTLPYFTDLLYYPTGVGLYFHTLNPLNGLLTLPVQLADGLIVAYNAVVLISWTLAGYGVFLLCLWLLADVAPGRRDERTDLRAGKRLAAFVAGLIYTFAPFHMAHLLGHMQVMSLQWLPFYILFLLRAMRAGQAARPWRRDALLAGLFLVFNGLSDWYFVLYLFLFTALAVVYFGVGAVTRANTASGRRWRRCGAWLRRRWLQAWFSPPYSARSSCPWCRMRCTTVLWCAPPPICMFSAPAWRIS